MMEITWKQAQRRETRQRRIFWLRLALILVLSMAILLILSLICPPLAGGTALAPTWTPTATATPYMWLPSPLPGPTQTWTATPGYRIPETPTCTPTLAATVGGPPCYVCKRCHGREECGTGWCYGAETYHLPPRVYHKGLNDREWRQWQAMLEAKGRFPCIVYPVMCAKCGKLWPEFFHVSDAEWNHYIEPGVRNQVLCRECYDHVRRVTGG